MPTINLEDFLTPIIRGDGHGHGSVSLVLFQAVMFSAVHFVDLKLLQSRSSTCPQLTLDDFVLDRASEPLREFLCASEPSAGYASADPTTRVALAVLCIQLSKLAVCVCHILHSQYAAVCDQPMIAEYFLRIIVVPKQSVVSQYDVGRCDVELDAWLSDQDPRAKYCTSTTTTTTEQKVVGIVRLRQALLHMNYLPPVSILHNPQVFHLDPNNADGSSAQRTSSPEKVKEAAVSLTKLGFDLQTSNQLQYLSTSSVVAFLSATLTHLAHIQSPEEDVCHISVGRFYQ